MRAERRTPEGRPPGLADRARPRRPDRLRDAVVRGPRPGASHAGRPPRHPSAPRPRPVETEPVSPLRGRQVRRRRRPRLLRWSKRAAATLAVAGMPSAVAAWLATSPRFDLSEARVEIAEPATAPGRRGPRQATVRAVAANRVPESWVRRQVEPFFGRNSLRLPLAAVAEPIERHPWVRSVDLSKELPASLRVRVVERREAAVLRDGGELFYLDADGRPIAAVDEKAAVDGLVVVSREARPPAAPGAPGPELAAALELLRELAATSPARPAEVLEIEILGEGDFRVLTAGLPFSLLVRAGTLEDRFRRLEDVLQKLVERYGAEAAVDLRFARRIFVQPSYRGPAATGAPAAGTQRKGDSG